MPFTGRAAEKGFWLSLSLAPKFRPPPLRLHETASHEMAITPHMDRTAVGGGRSPPVQPASETEPDDDRALSKHKHAASIHKSVNVLLNKQQLATLSSDAPTGVARQ